MNDIIDVALRTLLVLIVVFILVKIMGKKQISQMNIYDYIIGITIGSIAADISLDIKKDVIAGITSLAIYGCFSALVTYLTMKSLTIRRLVNGTPRVLMYKGKILYDSLKKEGIDVNDLLSEARGQGYFDLSQINYAILETSGKVSFLLKKNFTPITCKDMAIKGTDESLGINIIIDGQIIKENLKKINKTTNWVNSELTKHSKLSQKEVILMNIIGNKVNIYPKTKTKENYKLI